MDRLLSMRVFERVAVDGGFAAAARALDLSPPVVTRLVADLEEHLGVRLLQRSTRRLSLTEAGQAYLNRVRHILQDIDEAHASVSAHTTDLSGVLHLYAPPVLASYVVAPLIAGFRQRYPKIVLDLEVDSRTDPSVEDYDITLMATDASFDGDVIARRVADSMVILVAAPAYIARRGMPDTPQALVGHDCMRMSWGGDRPAQWRLRREGSTVETATVDVPPMMWANHTDTMLRAALDGAGIISVALDLVAPYLMRGDLVRVLNPWITGRMSLYAAMPSRKFVPQRTRAFLDYLTDETRNLNAAAMAACTAC